MACTTITLLLCTALYGQTTLSEARALVRSGKFNRAGQIVDRYLLVHTNSADAHYLRGYIFFKQQEPKRSLAEYTKGAKYRTPSAADLEAVAADYVLLRDFVDADKWFSKSAEWDPGNFQTLYYLGRTKYNENRFSEAVTVFHRCLGLRPRSVKAEDNLGLSYEGLGQMKDARVAFETAISWESRAKPEDSGPYIDLGSLLVDSSRPREAVPYLVRALQISPQEMRAHRELGKAYMHLDELAKARIELEKSARLAPENAPIRFMLAQVYRKLGLPEKAQAEAERYKRLAGASGQQ
ncbi:MAG: tetratricopeptide repeat protein [Bryobacteraceae bacterium]